MKKSNMDLHAKQKLSKRLLQGLIKGINRFFAQPMPVALVVQFQEDGPVHFFDPYEFLTDKQTEIVKYIQSGKVEEKPFADFVTYQEELADEPLPHNAVWFGKPTLDKVSNEIIREWLFCAQDMLSVDFNKYAGYLSREAKWAIEHFERHVIKNVVIDRNIDLPLGSIIQHLVELSGALEEGESASGSLLYVQKEDIGKYDFIAKLANHVPLSATKLARKLLTITQPGTALLSDGKVILGVVVDKDLSCLQADFNEGAGQLRVGKELICRFKDKTIISNPMPVDLSALESVLERRKVSGEQKKAMVHFVKNIVEHARHSMHGCTLVLDFRKNINALSPIGQNLSEPLDLKTQKGIELACQMAQVDGALHIDLAPSLHAFSCILPYRFETECKDATAARGARFNSALCFSSNEPETVTLVVSEDGPMSVFEKGHVLNMRHEPKDVEDREVLAVGASR